MSVPPKICAMESGAEITRITDVIEETLKKYDGRVIDRLDAWFFKLEAKLGCWPMDIAPAPTSTSTNLREDTDPSVLSEAGVPFPVDLGERFRMKQILG